MAAESRSGEPALSDEQIAVHLSEFGADQRVATFDFLLRKPRDTSVSEGLIVRQMEDHIRPSSGIKQFEHGLWFLLCFLNSDQKLKHICCSAQILQPHESYLDLVSQSDGSVGVTDF
jgi:hypothetical protein